MSDYDDLLKALLCEQFSRPLKEWIPDAERKSAERARVREIEAADYAAHHEAAS